MQHTWSVGSLGIVLVVAGCTVAVEPHDLESPDDGTDIDERGHTVPETTESVVVADEVADAWVDCKQLTPSG